jgi:integrase
LCYKARKLLKKAGLPDIRFHDLRHTCATLLTKGVHPKIVSEMLWHSSVSITLDVSWGTVITGQRISPCGCGYGSVR